MKKSTLFWLIFAVCLILAGALLFVSVMTAADWDFKKIATEKLSQNTHEITEDFYSVLIESDTADIKFTKSEKPQVVCTEREKQKHIVSVENNTLSIKSTDTRKWYERIGITFGTPKIEIAIPEGLYQSLSINEDTGDVDIPADFTFKNVEVTASTGDVSLGCSSEGLLKVNTSTGNIMATGLTAEELDLSVSTGTVVVENVVSAKLSLSVSTGRSALTNVTCRNFTSEGDTGDLRAKNLIAEESVSIKRSTGDVTFDRCDGGEITVLTDTGDIKGTLLSAKVFNAKTDTGRVKVPETAVGGRCNLTTDTGDIEINIVE